MPPQSQSLVSLEICFFIAPSHRIWCCNETCLQYIFNKKVFNNNKGLVPIAVVMLRLLAVLCV